jgi:glutamate racemase
LKKEECYIPDSDFSRNKKSIRKAKMHNKLKLLVPICFIILICTNCVENPTYARQDDFSDFFRKDEVTIVITDSGLGGLSILADAVERSKDWKSFQRINFVYFNALFSNEGGYNTLETHQEKVSIFDSALSSMEDRCNPDLILIGCNTLSTIYSDTAFSKKTTTPVRGIIEAGVNVACDALKAHPESQIILFATQTTVSQNSHKNLLLKKGFLPERITYQACPELARYIEEDYRSDETDMLICAYVDEALQKISDRSARLLVSFNCTHYGYSIDLWKNAFQTQGAEPISFLDPNRKMNDFLFRPQHKDRFQSTDISVRIISMVEIGKGKMDSLGAILIKDSSLTVEALQVYEWDIDLFEWQSFIKNQE